MRSTSDNYVSALERIRNNSISRGNSPAIVSNSRKISFRELIARASALAGELGRVAVDRSNGAIAVSTGDASQLVLCALAAWKLRRPYLPLDPSWPAERTCHILREAGVPVVATDSSSNIPSGNWRQISVNRFCEDPCPDVVPSAGSWVVEPTDIAYIIYTSGSTGRPKGVAVTHANLSNLIEWAHGFLKLGPRDRVPQLAALTFDASVIEIWPALSAGAALYTPDRSISLLPEELAKYFISTGITVSNVATVVAEHLLQLRWPDRVDLRFLFTGGDILRTFPPPSLPFSFANLYGPTECTVCATGSVLAARSSEGTLPSIGRPILNTEIFILDSKLSPVPDGQPGEICIGGAGVAAGYVGRPDLTAERFVQYGPTPHGKRIYRTGDLGLKLPDGNIQCLGRIDDQIKLRGYRIEPNEIAVALYSHPAVSNAVISLIGEGENSRLVAYVVLGKATSGTELRNHLLARLPGYMVPSCFVQVEKFPLSNNGKLDIKALPSPSPINMLATDSNKGPEHMDGLEQAIEMLWQALLPVKQIALDDDFFALGGNSLTAARLFNRLEARFGQRLQLSAILEASTIRKQARLIREFKNDRIRSLVVPLSTRGDGPPLFLIHPIGGNVLVYRDLALRLPCPVYGIEAAQSNREASMPLSMKRLAKQYIDAIQTVQSTGPYYLGGYSFGGIMASEMTYQLQKAGESVALVALIDTSVEPSIRSLLRQKRVKTAVERALRSMRHNARQIVELGFVRYFNYRLTRIAMGTGLVRPYYRVLDRLGWKGVPLETVLTEMAFTTALKTYNPRRLAARTLLFRASDSIADHIDSTLGWNGVVDGQLEVYDVPGDHTKLLQEPHVQSISDVIRAARAAVEIERSPDSAAEQFLPLEPTR
jgi:amino acid adenylation domain-containing protein